MDKLTAIVAAGAALVAMAIANPGSEAQGDTCGYGSVCYFGSYPYEAGDDNQDGVIDEDESGWDCSAMGNGICGEGTTNQREKETNVQHALELKDDRSDCIEDRENR